MFGVTPASVVGRSILDFVAEDARHLREGLGGGDRRKLDEYLSSIREVERQLILKTLEMAGGNRVRAAEILGISPKTLYNKLGRYHAKSESDKPEPEPADEV